MVARYLLPLLVLLAASQAHAAAPRGVPSAKAREQAILAKIKRQPMIFFVAKGEPNACGSGCSEWIAAEGYFDPDADRHFREFLDEPARRNLPVFFNSLGGGAKQSVAIGHMLRQYRMTAGVGRTIPEGCRPMVAMGDACRAVVASKREHRARFVAAGARCASGCVYALIGASARQVPRAAELGIHSVRYIWAVSDPARSSPPSTALVHEGLRNYAIELGVDPGLIDFAAKIDPDRIHSMTRSEIERFGIETRGFYETPWARLEETLLTFSVTKAWRQAEAGSNDYRTRVIRLRCSNSFGFLLNYRTELSLFELQHAPASAARPGRRRAAAGADVQSSRKHCRGYGRAARSDATNRRRAQA